MDILRIQTVLLQMGPFLMAIVFHEVAHAYVARLHGDRTAEQLGRLTLNPMPHLDPIGTILIPVLNMLTGVTFLFGWARPVPINTNRLKPYRRGLFLVAIAGPAANVVLALISAFVLVAATAFLPKTFYLYDPLCQMALISISLNYTLALFNLLPIPPLDGAKVLESFLSFEATRKMEQISQYGYFILMALLFSGALNLLAIPMHALTRGSVAIWIGIFTKLGMIAL